MGGSFLRGSVSDFFTFLPCDVSHESPQRIAMEKIAVAGPGVGLCEGGFPEASNSLWGSVADTISCLYNIYPPFFLAHKTLVLFWVMVC